MNTERLKRLIIQYQKSMQYYHDTKNAYNEQSCRDEYISPLLECFGWDVHNSKGTLPQYKEVVVEKFANSAERPDYTLTLNGISKMFVEAKKPSVDITVEMEPAMQARKYGWNAKHKLAILTNFENMLIYDTTNKPENKDGVNTSLYRKYNFNDYEEKYQEIYDLISRKNVYNGKYDEFVDTNFQDKNRFHTEVDDTFLEQINEWRLKLGRHLYSADARYKDIDVLNDMVQEFINQVVFLRICEDRKLPLYENLREISKDKAELQESLTQVFKEADKRYNSGLFKGNNVILDLNNDIIFEIIMSLYYPQTPYLFNIIEPSILGKIYEAFLTECLIVKDGSVELAHKNEYKYKSVVSTPTEIVKYMVKNTLDKVCLGKTPVDILKLRIVDMACGSGVFLEEAFQYIIDYCEQWYINNKPEHLLELSNGRKKIPIAEKKKILQACIYGVDIDIHAVEVSKFSLLLKLIENETEPSVQDETPVLPDLKINIKHGNSLVTDSDIEGLNHTTKQLIEIVPFDWKNINNGEKFDVILGNPPYVKTEDIKKLHNSLEVSIYKNYASAYKQYDKYYLFVEQAIKLLKEEGYSCYIIPNKFMHVESGQNIRRIVSNYIMEIDDFGSKQLFVDKTVYSAIVTIAGRKIDKLSYSEVTDVVSLWSKGRTNVSEIQKEKLNSKPWLDNKKGIVEEPWFISKDCGYLEMLEKTKDITTRITEFVDIYNGIQTSAEKIYRIDQKEIISEDDSIIEFVKQDKHYRVEKDILRRYFKPSRVEQGKLDSYSDISKLPKCYNIFPYEKNGDLIEKEKFELKYSNTWEYLKSNKAVLLPKNLGGKRDVLPKVLNEDEWYRYGRSQAITSLNDRKKLIVGVNRKKDNPLYLYDESNILIASGGTAGYIGVSCKPDSPYSLEYIQAWLTHPFTDKYLQNIGSDFEGGFIARGTYTLPMVPFIKLDFANEKQKELYELVVDNTQKIYKINFEIKAKTDKATLGILEKEKNKLIKQIEDSITKVYQQNFR